ncbi:MAG: lanthionine synthetase LanC family protein [Vicinamibacterales bacterium]
MDPNESLVLSEEVVVFPIAELDPAQRASIASGEGDYGLTKRKSRRTTRLIDRAAVDLLEEFRTPSSVPDAINRFSEKFGMAPAEVLHTSFELLSVLLRDGFLLRATPETISGMRPVEAVDGWKPLEPLRVLEDTEVHLVHSPSDQRGVLKRVSRDADRWIRRALINEARILRQLNGRVAPELLEDGSEQDAPYIVIAWRKGLPSALAAAQLRRPWVFNSRDQLATLCLRVLDAYAHLHALGILHADVQPSNILIDIEDERVSLIDFGLAVKMDGPGTDPVPRGGVEAFYSPEAARAILADVPLPRPTAASEQYAIAAVIYKLLTGHDCLEPRLDRAAWHTAVCSHPPRPFVRLGIPPWPKLEMSLARALAKEPGDRYPSVAAFRDEFASAAQTVAADTSASTRAWRPPGLFDTTLARLVDPDDVASRPLSRPSASLNFGATGIAYFLLRASSILQRPDLFAAADLWIERAKREALSPSDAFFDYSRGLSEDTVGKAALYHSAVGMHCVDALIACSANQPQRLAHAIGRMIETAEVQDRRADLVSGHAGQLIACATVLETLSALGHREERERVIALGQRRRDDLLGVWGPLDRPLPGASEAFYGIAHGWAGAAYAMLRFSEASHEPVAEAVIETLRSLSGAAIKAHGGAFWPRGSRDADVWTGWCHGSAGYVFLWAQAQNSLAIDDFIELAAMAGEHMWLAPPPEIGHLCCGAAGQGYAYLALHRLTGDARYVDRARQALDHGVGFVGTRGMSTDSLYKGDLGLALLELETSEPLLAAMPMFEPERWPSGRDQA